MKKKGEKTHSATGPSVMASLVVLNCVSTYDESSSAEYSSAVWVTVTRVAVSHPPRKMCPIATGRGTRAASKQ